jgi:ATP/maltotriose-dependent transcriptional regulator MalT
VLGDWDDVLPTVEELAELSHANVAHGGMDVLWTGVVINVEGGRLEEARKIASHFPPEPSAEVQETAAYGVVRAILARAEGRASEALAASEEVLRLAELGTEHPFMKLSFIEALEAGFDLGDLDAVEERLRWFRSLPPGGRRPLLEAHAERFRARLAAARGDDSAVEPGFKLAAALLREIGARFWLAVVLLEQGEWLAQAGRADEAEPLLEEAREIFEQLEAKPWLVRVDAVATPTIA